MPPRLLLLSLLFLFLPGRGLEAAPPPTPVLGTAELDSLSGSLRGFLIRSLPSPLYTTSQNWGNTRNVARGVHWKGKGIHVHPEVLHTPKNDGIWKRLTVTTPGLANSLILDLRNLQQPPHAPVSFDVFLSFEANAEYERQTWQGGVRLYSGSTRIRFRLRLAMKCEATSRLEKGTGPVPDLIFRLRVVKADLNYDNLVCEHMAGLGGEAARLLGEAIQGGLHRFRPSLERDLLARADAAIVKAADTKEVRLSLSRLLGQ
jgi:hypothetical protein